MADYTVGTASLKVRPDAREFLELLRADLDRMKDPGFTVDVKANTAQAASDIDRLRADQRDRHLYVGVDVALAQAEADMARFREIQKRGLTINVDADTSSAARKTRELKSNVLKDFNDIADGIGDVFSAVGQGLKFPLIFAGIGELPAVTTLLANVAGAIQQVAGAGLALPGIFAGAGASIGTLTLGLDGVKDALDAIWKSDGSAASIKKIDEAMKGLAPNARDFVNALADMKPQFDSLKNDIQQDIFANLSGDIRTLVDADLPTLRTGLGGIAQAWNQNIRQLTSSLGSDSSRGLLDRILGNTGEAQAKFTAAIDPLVHGIGTLTAAGTDVLPRLAEGFGGLAGRLDDFLSKADQDGRLDKWINDGVTGIDELGETFLNLGKGIASITEAAGGGQGLLTTLETGSAKLRDFLASTEGQNKLKEWFEEGREEIQDHIIPLLQSLPGIFEGFVSAGQVIADDVVPPLRDIAKFLGDHPHLVEAAVIAFATFKTVTAVGDLAGSLKNVTELLGGLGGKAETGAKGITAAFAAISIPEALIALAPLLLGGKIYEDEQAHPGQIQHAVAAGNAAQGQRFGVDGQPPVKGGSNFQHIVGGDEVRIPGGGGPGASNERRGAPGTTPPQDPLLAPYFPPRKDGGPTPSGRGPGPTGGFLAEIHSDEWILPKHARDAVGDEALWALTAGRSFLPGGYINPDGSPVTPGALPGPAGMATPTGGVAGLASSFLSGLGGLGGNASSLFGNVAGVGGAEGATGSKLTPGLWGLAQAGNDPNLLGQWGNQTGDWLGKFASKTLLSLGTTLWSGALGIFGLQDSILSPSNPYFQAVAKSAGFYLGDDGPFGSQGGKGGSTSKGAPTGKQMREGQEKVQRSDQRVDEIKQRIAELNPDAKQSQRTSLNNDLANAQQDAQDARTDFAALGGTAGSLAGGGSAPAGYAYGGHQDVADAVWQAYVAAGMPQGEWADFVKLENSEAGWNPSIRNASSGAYGIAQFLGAGNISRYLGGNSNAPLGVQATGMMRYLQDRYHGSPAAAWQFHLANNWYDTGIEAGAVPQGLSMVHNDLGANESMYILTPQQEARVKAAAVTPTPRPNFQTPDANRITGGAAPRPPAVAMPTPPPAPGQPPHLEAPPPEQFPAPTGAPQPNIGPAPSNLNHNLQAVNTGIESGAKTIGNIASSAINAAAAAGSFGAGGGGGGAGQFVSGLIQEGGKAVEDAANVVSSFLVGDTSLGSGPNAYGQTAIAPQQQPDTLPYGGPRTVIGGIYGHNTDDVFRQLDVRENQDRQGFYANK